MARYATCIHCGEEIRMVILPGGEEVALEPYPIECGTIGIHSDGIRAAALTDEEWKQQEPGVGRYVRHLPLCEEFHFGQAGKSKGHVKPSRN
jgi:hypothetical protein